MLTVDGRERYSDGNAHGYLAYGSYKEIAPEASIEYCAGHQKARFRMGRNSLKGKLADLATATMSVSTINLVNWMNRILVSLLSLLLRMIQALQIFRMVLVFLELKFHGKIT